MSYGRDKWNDLIRVLKSDERCEVTGRDTDVILGDSN
jgi:hypothetical protein